MLSELLVINNLKDIPMDLRSWRNWVNWGRTSGGVHPKVPFQPDGKAAQVNNKKTWVSFDDAVGAVNDGDFIGIGYVFSEADPFVGIDLDKCFDWEERKLVKFEGLVKDFSTAYTEISPSGTGVHIVGRGSYKGRGYRRDGVEVYGKERYFCITGYLYTRAIG